MRPFLVPMEVKQMKKYFEINKIRNTFGWVKPQDLLAGLYVINAIVSK